jgi:tRNA (cytidine/uridine-2'-O-)-methyltransferase
MNLALYQPEIAANLGASIRNCACFGARLHVIEPCGFPWRDRDIRRVALDYEAEVIRHASWGSFLENLPGRLILMTTKGAEPYERIAYRSDDTLLLGQESAGVPAEIHEAADLRAVIPLAPGARSLNVATAGAVVLAEASRQARTG